jgi:K+-transporting ATPase KdpF subunit
MPVLYVVGAVIALLLLVYLFVALLAPEKFS